MGKPNWFKGSKPQGNTSSSWPLPRSFRVMLVGISALALSMAGAGIANADPGQPGDTSQSVDAGQTTQVEPSGELSILTVIDDCATSHWACAWAATNYAGNNWHTPNVGNYNLVGTSMDNTIESAYNGRATGLARYEISAGSSTAKCLGPGDSVPVFGPTLINKIRYIQVSNLPC